MTAKNPPIRVGAVYDREYPARLCGAGESAPLHQVL